MTKIHTDWWLRGYGDETMFKARS